jgi:glycerol-3-phosphate dehydrogenase
VAWPYLEAEVIYAVRHEMACTPLDVLARRTRLAFLDTSAALGAVPRVVELMGRELGWNPDKAALELANAKSRILEAI